MKFRLWPRREPADPVVEQQAEPATEAEPEPADKPAEIEPPDPAPAVASIAVEPVPEAPVVAPPPPAPEPSPPSGAPSTVTLTIDEAKGAIKEAGGDVIQVGFLASAYRRNLEDDPGSAETAASRKRLRDLVGKRLKDRGLLAADGTVELRD